MRAVVTPGLVDAIERAARDSESEANQLKHSKEMQDSATDGLLRKIVEDAIEQRLQDYAVLTGWIARVRAEMKPK